MAAITAADRNYIRRKVGDTGSPELFSDADLDTSWDDGGESRTGAVVECLQELLVNAAKFNDYTLGQTSEKKQQIFDNLRMMLDYWTAQKTGAAQYRVVGIAPVPERSKDSPYGH